MNDNTLYDLHNPNVVAEKLGIAIEFMDGFVDAIDNVRAQKGCQEYMEGYRLGEEVFQMLSDQGFALHLYQP
jgi:hypothetical protein